MSETRITIEEVKNVQDHQNADRLSVIQVLGYQIVTGRDQFKVGDPVVYFPPDILIPDGIARELGVEKYLKHATYPGDSGKSQCRVSAARLRGVPSYGFVSPSSVCPCSVSLTPGTDVTGYFGGVKYEPPVREGAGDAEREFGTFHKYTSIENIQRCTRMLDGCEVVITEKIHGTNCRMGLCRDNSGELIYMAGSHKIPRKEGPGLYWSFMKDVRQMLSEVSDHFGCADVIVFGEIFGKGVQDLTYGQTDKSFRAFDISVNGEYLNYFAMKSWCEKYGIKTVPELYVGGFSDEIVQQYTHGDTTFQTSDKFKGREGIVIRPISERVDHMGRRMILKSVSADYLDRKGAQDLE